MPKNNAEYIQTAINDIKIDCEILSHANNQKSPLQIIQRLTKQLADDSKNLPGLNKIRRIAVENIQPEQCDDFLNEVIRTQKQALKLLFESSPGPNP